jgi:dihydrofolate synthase/folylpolyglutamate synthase
MPFTTYKETVEYLYAQLPVFHRIGPKAFKPDLKNTLLLLDALDNPHLKFKSVHIAGTNGKGSSAHMLAAILQSAGMKTGLFTSPHLKSFTERIRVDGIEIPETWVVEFINRMQQTIERIGPSFFEVNVAMAFDYFYQSGIDIAVIETGLGGRLDATNVVKPLVALITNIGHDHLDILGPTLKHVAHEKAGIIKPEVPVVISERQNDLESVFIEFSKQKNAPIIFAELETEIAETADGFSIKINRESIIVRPELKGSYQKKNLAGVISVIRQLEKFGLGVAVEAIQRGIEQTVTMTGLKGRWQKLQDKPTIICDTAHNPEGIRAVLQHLDQLSFKKLHWILGMVEDKDVGQVLKLLPVDAEYYFCKAEIPRAMGAAELKQKASGFGLHGEVIPEVNKALKSALKRAAPDDLILVAGSTYVVAEVENI